MSAIELCLCLSTLTSLRIAAPICSAASFAGGEMRYLMALANLAAVNALYGILQDSAEVSQSVSDR